MAEHIKNQSAKYAWGFSVGRDRLFLDYHYSQFGLSTIVDRLFVSTCVYATIFKRANKIKIYDHFKTCLEMIVKNNEKIIYILRNEKPEEKFRQRNDGFDTISYDLQRQVYNEFLSQIPIGITQIFVNHFDENSIINYNNFLKKIIYEYQRF